MAHADKNYNDLANHVKEVGVFKDDRTGTGTYSVFGYQARYDLQEGFPLLQGKKIRFDLIVTELLWFLHGDTNIKYLVEHNNHIWDEWAFEKYINSPDYTGPDMTNFGLRSQTDSEFKELYEEQKEIFCNKILTDETFAQEYGELGPVYGRQWRSWTDKDGKVIDQIKNVIHQIKSNPNSRRHIVSAWNPSEVDNMALPPCHTLFQFYVAEGKLSCQLYQRSADIFLGVPFNIASYALLTHIIADQCGLEVGDFVHTLGDAHIYKNHLEQLDTQVERPLKPMPTLKMTTGKQLEDLTVEDFTLNGYNPHPRIKGAVAV